MFTHPTNYEATFRIYLVFVCVRIHENFLNTADFLDINST